MAVLINFKICDNAKECGGVEVCPTKALSWSDKDKKIVIDNSKCISCGKCEAECPIGAIRVAHNEAEYNKIKNEIDKDERTIKDLFVDRYGAVSISDFFRINVNEISNKIENDSLVLIEVYNPDFAECLLKSIPIKEITNNLPENTLYYKVEVNNDFTLYNVNTLPTLLIFKNKNLLGHIDGYYNNDNIEEFIDKLNNIIEK